MMGQAICKDFHRLVAADVMRRDVATCRRSDCGRYAAAFMDQFECGSLPVIDPDGDLVGLVTEYDLLRALWAGRDLRQVQVAEIMTPEVCTVTEDMPVAAILRLFEAENLIRAPVVAGGKLKGVVARRDILRGYIRSIATDAGGMPSAREGRAP